MTQCPVIPILCVYYKVKTKTINNKTTLINAKWHLTDMWKCLIYFMLTEFIAQQNRLIIALQYWLFIAQHCTMAPT